METKQNTRIWTKPILVAYKNDGYKQSHKPQYPKGTTMVYSNYTPRGAYNKSIERAVVFGLQFFVKTYLIEDWDRFFAMPKNEAINQFRHRIHNYCGKIDDSHIADLHDLSYLPLEVKGLPEGSLCPFKVPFITVKSTKDEFFWVTNFIETPLSTQNWMSVNSATTAFEYLKIITKYADETVGNRDFVQWQGHDFSMRGMSSLESAYRSGMAHLTCFTGTDTIPAIDYVEMYYCGDASKQLIGGSIPATEHAVMSAGGKENEIETLRRLITEVYPIGPVSVVSDTWDLWKLVTEYLTILKPEILARDGKLVIRPDSGDPVKIICGDAYIVDSLKDKNIRTADSLGFDKVRLDDTIIYKVLWSNDKEDYKLERQSDDLTPANLGVIECLWNIFGGTITEKGYKLLDSHIGAIYGDSISLERCYKILEILKRKGFCSYNIVFGLGSYSYQYVSRDSLGQAMKATGAIVDGEFRELFKDPITDDGTKRSARGFLRVDHDGEKYVLRDQVTEEESNGGCLEVRFKDGEMFGEVTFEEVRSRIKKNLDKIMAAKI